MKVYIEPKPKARIESAPIDHYEIEKDGGGSVDNRRYGTQKEAYESAKRQGYDQTQDSSNFLFGILNLRTAGGSFIIFL